MRIGIVGAGRIGATAGRQWAAAGHELVLSFARDEGRLAALAEELGARTGTPAEAAAFGEVVLFSPPWTVVDVAAGAVGSLDGKVVIDTTNPFGPEPVVPEGSTAGEEVARRLPGARVVKAYNTLEYGDLAGLAGREGDERVVLPLCGDDADAKRVVAGLIEQSGFAPLDRGPRAAAGGQEPGGPLFGTPTTVGDGAAPAAER